MSETTIPESNSLLEEDKNCHGGGGFVSVNNGENDHHPESNRQKDETKALRRNMKFHNCFALVFGSMVGAGIFITPSLVARSTPNLFVSLLAWILAGGLALLGALCYCEMVSVVKKTGSSYVFVLDCYGKAAGFIVNWSSAFIYEPCGACILLVSLGLYACAPFFQDHNSLEYIWCSKLVGLAVVYVIACISCLGGKKSGSIQLAFTSVQLLTLATVFSMGVYAAVTTTGSYENLKPDVTFNNTLSSLQNNFPAFGIAMFNALYCFDGYYTIAFFVEEAINPTKMIPLLTFTTIPFVTFIYILIVLSCAAVLSHHEIATTNIFVAEVAERVGGKAFLYSIPFFVVFSVIPALTSVFYRLPRLIMSSAREGQFPSIFSLIHKERRTPIPAIMFVVVFTTLLTLCDFSLQTMIQICNISIWFEYTFTISTILKNRWKRPEVPRTYRTWITTPVIVMIVPVILFVLAFLEKPVSTSLIISVMAISAPVYYIFLYKKWLHTLFPDNRICLWLMKNFPLVKCKVNDESDG